MVDDDIGDSPLDRIPQFARVSFRAVVVPAGQDPGPALAAAGIVDPIALPIVFGDDPPAPGFGDGVTPNVAAVLAFDRRDDGGSVGADGDGLVSGGLNGPAAETEGTAGSGGRSANLPPAFGMQPLAPVRR